MSRYFHDYDNVAIFDLNEELAMGEHAYEISSSTKTPLLFPVNMDLSGLPPLCIHVGDHEVILSDSVRLAERARASNVHVE